MKSDICNREDIVRLVNALYGKLLEDALLSPIFVEVAGLKLTDHLPVIYDFWESVLFQVGKYKGNTLEVHLELHRRHTLRTPHFERWLALFNESVDELFAGETADGAKERARSVATIIKMKIDHLERQRIEFGN